MFGLLLDGYPRVAGGEGRVASQMEEAGRQRRPPLNYSSLATRHAPLILRAAAVPNLGAAGHAASFDSLPSERRFPTR